MSETMYSYYDGRSETVEKVTCCDLAVTEWQKSRTLVAAIQGCVPSVPGWQFTTPALLLKFCPHCGTKYGEKT